MRATASLRSRPKLWLLVGLPLLVPSVSCAAKLAAAPVHPAAAQPTFNMENVSVRRVTTTEKVAGTHLAFEPVPVDYYYTPGIDAQHALLAAEAQLGLERPTGATLTLASSNGVIVWNVDFAGICTPRYGPDSYSPGNQCVGNDLNVVLDATTGEFIEAYSYSGSGP
jgi:hypothetical protein